MNFCMDRWACLKVFKVSPETGFGPWVGSSQDFSEESAILPIIFLGAGNSPINLVKRRLLN